MEEVILLERFVKTCEKQVLVIVFEGIGNLRPQLLQALYLGTDGLLVHLLITLVRLAETLHLYPSIVPMVIQDHI